MLIGIGGATLSGKTTTAQKFYEELINMGHSVAVIPEFAKEVAEEMGFKRVDDIRKDPLKYFEFELEILKRKTEAEAELVNYHDFIICDTTTAEIALYSERYLPPALSRTIVELAKNNLNRYDVIFLLEPLNVPSNNGFRSKRDIVERTKHHEILKSIYQKYVEVPVTTISRRLDIILSTIFRV